MSEKLRLSFGMYRGFYIDEAPLDYLSWVLANIRLSMPMQGEIRKVLKDAEYPVDGHEHRWNGETQSPFDPGLDIDAAWSRSRGQRTIKT